ncbi:MAG: uL15 family ribosomal protein [Candidatus Paceibacterota bacterium]|jgi:large subunit ribosomal protein L15
MQTHNVKRNTKNRKNPAVGRGGKRGKTSGRGTKGQKARAGNKRRPQMRDTIKKIPKRRGYGMNRARTVNSSVVPAAVVNIDLLEKRFQAGSVITPEVLVENKLIRRVSGKFPPVKILARGTLTKNFSFKGCLVSAKAKEIIETVGGTVA